MIINGDCIEEMKAMDANSVDAIVTDPPYGIEFMGKSWDNFNHPNWSISDGLDNCGFKHRPKPQYTGGQAYLDFTIAWATEALRVLKPGGSLLCFGGTRTFAWEQVGLELAGFQVKDCLMYLYGAGFPKAQDLGKLIDKRAGVEREVVGEYKIGGMSPDRPNFGANDRSGGQGMGYRPGDIEVSAPATDLARHWDGYKIGGIKPSFEPIIWAVRAPEGSWTDNVLTYGVGAVNVDECRIDAEPWTRKGLRDDIRGDNFRPGESRGRVDLGGIAESHPAGRFPSNLILDEEAAKLLDEQSGVSTSSITRDVDCKHNWASSGRQDIKLGHGDTGGASRFFYTSKATDRDPYNDHPTLKPTNLIEWLVRLVTRPGQLVLDPFAGSGTTGVACIHSARDFILIEQDEHYCEIAGRRTTENVQGGMF